MTVTCHLHESELTANVFESTKALFPQGMINITVTDVTDTTEYLLSTQANRESNERSIREAEEGNVVEFTVEEFQKKYGQ